MSNTDTATEAPNTNKCKDCELELSNSYSIRCDKCFNRSDNNDGTHEIALVEDTLRRGTFYSLDETFYNYARNYLRLERAEANVPAHDHRIAHIWDELWDALSGDIEQDETWGMFMDAIPGMPDLRIKMFEVEIPLETITLTVQAKDEDEAIELAMEQAESDYSLEDVIYQPYIRVHEA